MAFCLLNKQTFQIREKKNCAFSGALHSTVVWESHTIKRKTRKLQTSKGYLLSKNMAMASPKRSGTPRI